MESKLLLIHALSALHAGAGQGVGVIDLPIAREKATGVPYLPGSTIKGVLRNECDGLEGIVRIFGEQEAGGLATFTDARLLLIPIRSVKGVFAWVTSPLLLRRLVRDAQGINGVSFPDEVPNVESEQDCVVAAGSALALQGVQGDQGQSVVLEDLVFQPKFGDAGWATNLAKMIFPSEPDRVHFSQRFCIVADDALSFLLETATQVTARISLNDQTKTTVKGALWYEEALPAETVMVGLVLANKAPEAFEMIGKATASNTMQLGGNATVGAGLCKLRLVGTEAA